MPCQALWDTSAGGYRVYVHIPVVFAGKRDCLAVRREGRVALHTCTNGESLRLSSASRNGPEVAGISENNVRLVGGMIYISMYVIPAVDSPTVPVSDTGWDFRVQVLNEDYSFAQCSIGVGSTALVDCTVDLAISRMAYGDGSPAGQWPVNADGTIPGQAFVTAGTQTSAWKGIIPAYLCDGCANAMWTNGLWLGFGERRRPVRPGRDSSIN